MVEISLENFLQSLDYNHSWLLHIKSTSCAKETKMLNMQFVASVFENILKITLRTPNFLSVNCLLNTNLMYPNLVNVFIVYKVKFVYKVK